MLGEPCYLGYMYWVGLLTLCRGRCKVKYTLRSFDGVKFRISAQECEFVSSMYV